MLMRGMSHLDISNFRIWWGSQRIFAAVWKFDLPVLVGVSEGERATGIPPANWSRCTSITYSRRALAGTSILFINGASCSGRR